MAISASGRDARLQEVSRSVGYRALFDERYIGGVTSSFIYVLSLRCADAPGIVKATAEGIGRVEGNILESDQFSDPITGTFCLRTRFSSPRSATDEILKSIADEVHSFYPEIELRPEVELRRVVIMVSTADHCLVDLLSRKKQSDLAVEVVAVVSNHETCREVTESFGINFHHVAVTDGNTSDIETRLLEIVETHDVDFVVLARYMQILSSATCSTLAGRVINIHHSFLPSFKGARPYHQAYERGVKIIGASAHFVTTELDEGPIIDQDVTRVSHARRPEDLVSLGRNLERTVLSHAVALVAEDRVVMIGRRTVVFDQ